MNAKEGEADMPTVRGASYLKHAQQQGHVESAHAQRLAQRRHEDDQQEQGQQRLQQQRAGCRKCRPGDHIGGGGGGRVQSTVLRATFASVVVWIDFDVLQP